jgi:uncharacterized protein YkwD
VLVSLSLLVSGCSSTSVSFPPIVTSRAEGTSPTLPIGESELTRRLVRLSNESRRKGDVGELEINPQLMRAAQLHADQMARLRMTGHVIPEAPYPHLKDRIAAAGSRWASIGENLAAGQRSAEEAVDSWMRSPKHRENLLSPDFTEIGTGYAVDAVGMPYYVQVFGRPRR